MASTENTIITDARRHKLVAASGGFIEIPVITGMAFGDGGVDSGGQVIPPESDQSELYHEIYRQELNSRELTDEYTAKYTCILEEDVLPGSKISEIGLYDADGDLICIRTMTSKGKDSGLKLTFTLEDQF